MQDIRVSIGRALFDHHDGSPEEVLVVGIDHKGLQGWLELVPAPGSQSQQKFHLPTCWAQFR